MIDIIEKIGISVSTDFFSDCDLGLAAKPTEQVVHEEQRPKIYSELYWSTRYHFSVHIRSEERRVGKEC